jgi:hypothetical protein
MRKGLILAGLLITLTATYLFYNWCKRDTFVIYQNQLISIPDSCWIYGSVDIQQIKKDIAWSSILNGDFSILFESDSTSSTFSDIIKSPEMYSIVEDSTVCFFGKWHNNYNYTSLLFAISKPEKITRVHQSDSLFIQNQYVYSFRTKEGFWLYTSTNLLFVGTANSDSIYAHSLLKNKTANTIKKISAHTQWANCFINSNYIPNDQHSPLFDSTTIELNVIRNNTALEVEWHYTGFATELFNVDTLTIPNDSQGLEFACNFATSGCKKIITKNSILTEAYKKEQALFDMLIESLNGNTCRVEFNGWNRIKNSYYTSVMNDEFEMVLQKKDTSYIEPNFSIRLNQQNKERTTQFIQYLQKNGLVSNEKNGLFDVVLGNFDSEIRIDKSKPALVFENKHHTLRISTGLITKVHAALVLNCNPSNISGLYNPQNTKALWGEIPVRYQTIENLSTVVYKEKTGLHGKTELHFKNDKSPIISFMQLLKK